MIDTPDVPQDERPGNGTSIRGVPLTPQDEALYEAGKAMLVESIAVGREFCKFMIGVATGAIPIYLSVLHFILPDKYELRRWDDVWVAIPVLCLLASATLFVWGYFPGTGSGSLDLPDDIEGERKSAIKHRQLFARWGFLTFILGVLLASYVTLFLRPS